MSGRGASGNIHDIVEFPDDLKSTFSSGDVTSGIAANFPGVTIMKDTVSTILHVFGNDDNTVDKAVLALREFISELCIQKLYAEGFSENRETENLSSDASSRKKVVAARAGSGSSSDDNGVGTTDQTCLEIKLKDVAPDLTDEEIRENFQWMPSEQIVVMKEKDTEFISGEVFVKFKTRRDCVTAKEQLSIFYPNYETKVISKLTFDSSVASSSNTSNNKKDSKKPPFGVSDHGVLDEYLRLHESDDGSDPEQLKKEALFRRKLLSNKGNDEGHRPPNPPRPKSSEAPGPSRRQLSPPHPNQNMAVSSKRQFGGGPQNSHYNGDNPYSNMGMAGNRLLSSSSSSRIPYQQHQAPQIPPLLVPGRRLRPIAIDANNLCMAHGNHQFYSCVGLELAVNYFIERGHSKVYAFVPEIKIRCPPNAQNPRIERQDILHSLEARGNISVVPRKKRADGSKLNPYDDVLIVKFAFESQGVIISNDNMIDVGLENPRFKRFIDEWRITFCFAGDHFLLVDDPNGRRGLRAEDMLSFPN